jgi:hypothetical protein
VPHNHVGEEIVGPDDKYKAALSHGCPWASMINNNIKLSDDVKVLNREKDTRLQQSSF